MTLEESIPQLLSLLELESYYEALSLTTKLLLNANADHEVGTDAADIDADADAEAEPLSESLKKTIQQIHCRTLITLSKYTQLVDYYNNNNNDNNDNDSLFLEYVYALYKLGRYVQCRDLIQTQLKKQTQQQQQQRQQQQQENRVFVEGMMHILAQCQYRLYETNDASITYSTILKNDSNTQHQQHHEDANDELLTNALAVTISNTSNIGTSSDNGNDNVNDNDNKVNIIQEKVMKKMKQIERMEDNTDDDDDDDDYLYELVYNAATQLLLQSTSLVQTKKAMEWLCIAEQKCKDEYEIHDDDDDDNNDNNDDNVNTQDKEQRTKTQSKNLMPIQANIALAKMKLGDWNGSTRSYLELILALKKIIHSGSSSTTTTTNSDSFTGGGALVSVENNLAVLNSKKNTGSSTSVFDLLKRLPDITSQDNVDSSGSGSAGAGSTDTGGVGNKMTPHQVRTLLYNRAVLFLKMNKYTECKAVLSSLKRSLSNTSSSTGTTALSNNNSNNNATKKKRSKKGGKGDASGTKGGSTSNNLAAPVATSAESILWESRIEVLEYEINCISMKEGQTDGLDTIIEKIKSELQKTVQQSSTNDSDDDDDKSKQVYILEYALSEVVLYKSQKMSNINDNDSDAPTEEMHRILTSTLEDLPQSIRQRPAIIATLCSLYSQLSMDDKVQETLESTNSASEATETATTHESLAEFKRLGDFKLRLGLYEEAAAIYKSILNELEKGNSTALDEDESMECKAGLIKAMSYFDIESAVEYAEEVSFDHEDLDGEELEAMDIPRLSKGVSGSNRMRKMLGNHRNSEEKQKKEKNHDAILRRRAKKREVYLEKLQKEGKYNPDRPLKPDPERWVPKSQRSYNKRGRKGRTKFVGAQGIGSGAGADKDAAKLDAAARAKSKAEGKDVGNQGRSTAHLAVSSSGTIGGRRR